jgi:CelD/BcsL family acetyltransferase involved in cellulose biosynthesis
MKIDLLSGSEATAWTNEQTNREKWKNLYDRCLWGTVCQSEEFVLSWYDAYHSQYTPILISSTDSNGELTGLLTMAVSNDSGELSVAGGGQAEYQTWLANPDDGNSFIEAALQKLNDHFPDKSLRLLFVPPSTPLEFVRHGKWAQRSDLRHMPRALMSTKDANAFSKSLRKTSNKSRLNRLARMGEVRLERITGPKELDAIFDEVSTYGSFRHAAIHGVKPGRDPLKKRFYLAMMAMPRLLHVTVLRVGGQIASSHIGVYNKDQVLLGMLAHSPFFAKHSPSKLHLLMLGEELAKEGITAFDLTPGGEYKDRFATHHDSTHILTIFFNPTHRLKYKAKRKVIEGGKYALQLARITPAQAKDAIDLINHKRKHVKVLSLPPKLLKVATNRLWNTREMRVYTFDLELARELKVPQLMKRDYLPDLLAYDPVEGWQLRLGPFLRGALNGLERGSHVYTHVEDGRLVNYAWLIERQNKAHLTEVGQDLYLPRGSAALANAYTHPVARGKGLYKQSLLQMAHDAALIPGTTHIFGTVVSDNLASRHVMEKIGFKYQFSFFTQTVGGKTKRWSTAPAEFTSPRDV